MLQSFNRMSDVELEGKRVLIREDLNVPIKDGLITNEARIHCALPTLKAALEAQAKVMVMSHLGRPKAGEFDPAFSLKPVANILSDLLKVKVTLVDSLDQPIDLYPGELVLFENVRFWKGEKENDPVLAKKMASLCDVFVMDAFGTAHRAQASTEGVANYAKQVCAGPLLAQELASLSAAFDNPARPLAAIVGGSKVSSKIQLLDALVEKVDVLIVGGGIANTFLKATGVEIGNSLHEPDWVEKTKALLAKAQQKNVLVPLPVDVVVADELSPQAKAEIKPLDQIPQDKSIFDVGPKTAASYANLLKAVNTLVWNGPVGVFEIPAFSAGTQALAQAIANSEAFSVAGGGDTLAAIDQFGVREQISYISTGGGAFLTYLEGGELPAVKILQKRFVTG